MARMTLKSIVNEERTECCLELSEDGKPLGHITLDSAGLDGLIASLARHRAMLVETVTPTLDPGARLEAVLDPAWKVEPREPDQMRVLALRHPGHGWLAFLLPREEAQSIASWLTNDQPQGS